MIARAASPADMRRIAKSVAFSFVKRLPPYPEFQLEDLVSVALTGVLDAQERWEPSRGTFAALARRRASGEVLDYIRRCSILSRADVKAGVTPPTVLYGDRAERHFEMLEDTALISQERMVLQHEMRACMQTLPARLQDVLRLYYDEERTLADVGAQLGVGESRASQLASQALKELRQAMTIEAPAASSGRSAGE